MSVAVLEGEVGVKIKRVIAVAAAGLIGCMMAGRAQSEVRVEGPVTTLTLPSGAGTSAGAIDFAHAKPMPLPASRRLPPSSQRNPVDLTDLFGPPRVSLGGVGSGVEDPVQLVQPSDVSDAVPVPPPEFGSALQPYTTSRVNAKGNATTKFYPYRAAGLLYFLVGGQTVYCSASLIKPGILVTAANCVAKFGQQQFYSGWTFVPAYDNGRAPFGVWHARNATILTVYWNGTDSCFQAGVVCQDDIAVITEKPKNGAYPGASTGWFGFGVDGYGYTSASQALLTELGYSLDLDSGKLMERSDAQGFVYGPYSFNTLLGSLMTDGSNGSPWLVNLGIAPSLSGGVSFGSDAKHNIVVNVTSWGNSSIKQQGASPFTSANITVLIRVVCKATPAAC
jgi:hypothetical protein